MERHSGSIANRDFAVSASYTDDTEPLDLWYPDRPTHRACDVDIPINADTLAIHAAVRKRVAPVVEHLGPKLPGRVSEAIA